MKTPIEQFVSRMAQSQKVRFYMPGHKGNWEQSLLREVLSYDITEIAGADALYAADGIIGESEGIASELFGSHATLYSTQGSTLCIQTMLLLVSKRGKKVLAGRNAHISFVNACALLGIEPIWILPEQADSYGICGKVTAEQVAAQLALHPDAAAVYLTSPDYLGNTVDLASIAALCRAAKVLLVCDNAHGAYLKFTGDGKHPLDQGADLCCDSAHKTLPVLTGGAYLHIGKTACFTKREAKDAMSLFGSTSPSYLILLSLDLCNRYLGTDAQTDFVKLKQRMLQLKQQLSQRGFALLENRVDFAKLTLDANQVGYTGTELADYFSSQGIEVEYANDHYLISMLSPFNTEQDVAHFVQTAADLPFHSRRTSPPCVYWLPEQVMYPAEAFARESELVSISDCVGRICAQTISSCPPGTAVIVPGEKITQEIKNICEKGGNFQMKVLK